MKRILIALAIMTTLVVASCGSTETTNPTPTDSIGVVADSANVDTTEAVLLDSAR